MQITHEQAHQLIQLNLDNVLNPEQSATLFAHLRDCLDCQSYANELKEVEALLYPVMTQRWTDQPAPLSIPVLMGKSKQSSTVTFLTIRKAAMVLVLVALFFSAWQFVSSGPIIASPVPLAVPLVPTPSSPTAQLTSATEKCEMRAYSVQRDDTLAGIAARFSVPAEEIMAVNGLRTKALEPAMELLIPSCDSTPTGTVRPATLTTTYTPILASTTSTPDG